MLTAASEFRGRQETNLFSEQHMPAQFISKLPSAHLKGNGLDQAFSEAATGLPVEERVLHKDAQLEPSISSESSDEALAIVVIVTKTPTYGQSATL